MTTTHVEHKPPYAKGIRVDMGKPIDHKSRCRQDPLLAKLVRVKKANTDWGQYAKNTAIGAGVGAGLGGLLNYVRGGSVGKGLAFGGLLGGAGGAGYTAYRQGDLPGMASRAAGSAQTGAQAGAGGGASTPDQQYTQVEGVGWLTPDEYQWHQNDPEGFKAYAQEINMWDNLERANIEISQRDRVGALADMGYTQTLGRVMPRRLGGVIDAGLTVGTVGMEHWGHGDRQKALAPLYQEMQEYINAGDQENAAAVANLIRESMGTLSQQHQGSAMAGAFNGDSVGEKALATLGGGMGAWYNVSPWGYLTAATGDISDHMAAARTEASLPPHLRRSGAEVGAALHRQELDNTFNRQQEALNAGVVPGLLETASTIPYRNIAVGMDAGSQYGQTLRENTNRADDMIARADRWLASGGITPEHHKELVDAANAMRPNIVARAWSQTGGRAADAGAAGFRGVSRGLGWLGSKIF